MVVKIIKRHVFFRIFNVFKKTTHCESFVLYDLFYNYTCWFPFMYNFFNFHVILITFVNVYLYIKIFLFYKFYIIIIVNVRSLQYKDHKMSHCRAYYIFYYLFFLILSSFIIKNCNYTEYRYNFFFSFL